MTRLIALLGALVGITSLGPLDACGQNEAQSQQPQSQQQSPENSPADVDSQALQRVVSRLQREKKLVGLNAVIMADGNIVATAVAGERRNDSGVALEKGDRFHIGSITKSMTATMIGRLIERGQMNWTQTVADCFPDELEAIDPGYRAVTLQQLLTHTAAAPANFPAATQRNRPVEGPQRVTQRRQEILAIMKSPPQGVPGEVFRYSNVGYTIAGAMAEAVTGKSWETLIREEVFAPLKMTEAGFGPPQDFEGRPLSQPRGHRTVLFMKQAVSVDADNTPILGPAGIIHMTLPELCRYGQEHLIGEVGRSRLLTQKTFRQLHTPRLNEYACGWVVPKSSVITEQRFLWHNGSNTMWYCLLALLPDSKRVIAVAANDGDIRRAEAAAFEIVKHFAGRSPRPEN